MRLDPLRPLLSYIINRVLTHAGECCCAALGSGRMGWKQFDTNRVVVGHLDIDSVPSRAVRLLEVVADSCAGFYVGWIWIDRAGVRVEAYLDVVIPEVIGVVARPLLFGEAFCITSRSLGGA